MISCPDLPLLASDLTNTPQVLVTGQRVFFAVAMLPDFGIASWRDADIFDPACGTDLIELALVIAAITADLLNLARGIPHQLLTRFGIIDTRPCQGQGLDFLAAFVHTQV